MSYLTQTVTCCVVPHLGRYLLCHTSLKQLPVVSYLTQAVTCYVIRHSGSYLLCHTSLRQLPVVIPYLGRNLTTQT